ncbi:MAG: class I SAM-dependent methyltransferase [Planctomycetota bacterium]|nr:class I SAM-dependent methyltransferase [Planctomycetota bacterium]
MDAPATTPPTSDLAKPWNSATTLCIARHIDELARGRTLDILDVGCGDGVAIELLAGAGHRLYGYDLAYRKDEAERRLKGFFGADYDSRIRFVTSGTTIPFADESFDVLFANQVFEHVMHLDALLKECARVLRPGGALIALFPFATYPLEGHVKIPFAHWIPPGALRRCCMYPFYALRLRPVAPARTAREAAAHWDEWLAKATFYRFRNEVEGLARAYFERFEVRPQTYIQARIDLQRRRGGLLRRLEALGLSLTKGRLQSFLMTYGFMAVLVIQNPKRAQAEPPAGSA